MVEGGEGEVHVDQPQEPDIRIVIDGMEFTVTSESITGAELRRLAHPPISPERDVWVESPGASDRLVRDEERVPLASGMRFFTVPVQISMG